VQGERRRPICLLQRGLRAEEKGGANDGILDAEELRRGGEFVDLKHHDADLGFVEDLGTTAWFPYDPYSSERLPSESIDRRRKTMKETRHDAGHRSA
jgi:hypothetical protein